MVNLVVRSTTVPMAAGQRVRVRVCWRAGGTCGCDGRPGHGSWKPAAASALAPSADRTWSTNAWASAGFLDAVRAAIG